MLKRFSPYIALALALGLFIFALWIIRTPLPKPLDIKQVRQIILITPDTLRYDRLKIMPNVQAWAEDATQYEYALSTAAWTSPSFAAIMTGKYPKEVRHYEPPPVDHVDWISAEHDTIAEVLNREGFRTVAFVSAATVGFDGGFAQGFDEFYMQNTSEIKYPKSTEIFADAMDWLDAHPYDDCFIWLHCWDTHWPYAPPKPDERLCVDIDGRWDYEFDPWAAGIRSGEVILTQNEKHRMEYLYDEEARFFDKRFGRFIRWQEENYPDALVIFTSDHGEEFWEHGGFEHGHQLYDDLMHVPLIVKGPNIPERIIEDPFSTKDVFWIIAEGNFSEAIGLDAKYHNQVIFGPPQYAITKDGYRYILNDETKFEELYDYRYDPEMKQNLAPDMRKKIEEMRGLMYEFRKGKALDTPDAEELREELKSIGYLGG